MKDDAVLVVGSGLVGLCTAAALAARGVTVILLGEHRAGEASPAAAGMLAPSVEPSTGAAHDFGIAARDRYPAFLDWVWDATGRRVALDRNGILQLAVSEADASRLGDAVAPGTSWLSPVEVHALEPALVPVAGAAFYPADGSVDNGALVDALEEYARRAPEITVITDRVRAILAEEKGATVACASGRQYHGSAIVLAAGAWSSEVAGLPRKLPIEPVRGQLLSLASAPLRHVVFGTVGYLVPRAGTSTIVGSTMERVGFDASTSPAAQTQLRDVAAKILPALSRAPLQRHWSGLRPLTPDFQPIVGRDPTHPTLIYACGHSRNGILMAPLTGDCVAALICGETPPYDLSPFSPSRF